MLGQVYIPLTSSSVASFRTYENYLINSEYQSESTMDHGLISALRVVSLPRFVDGRFMAAKPTSTNNNPRITMGTLSIAESEILTTTTASLNWGPLTTPTYILDTDSQHRIDNTGGADYYNWIFDNILFGNLVPEENLW